MMSIVTGLFTLAYHRKLVELVTHDIKNMWMEWELRGLILISLAAQVILIQLGHVRKHSPSTQIRMALWCAYVLGGFVALVALSVISLTVLDVSNASDPISQHHKPQTIGLMAFWAQFLLIHLGGPDTITAFSFEDNTLWLRHFIHLMFQSAVSLYILLLSWPGCSDLPLLSLLVYVVGFIKCFERVQALRLANTENLRDSMLGPADPGPDYPKFLEKLHLKKSQGFKVNVEEVLEPPIPENNHQYPQAEGRVVSEAYILFQTFKRIFVDLILTFEDQDNSQSYFRHLQPNEAFHAVEIELGFAYDMLYTKATVVYTSSGIVLRFISGFVIFMVPIGLFFWCDMAEFQMFDVVITYLLIGALVFMEIFSCIAMLRSDWTDHWLSLHKRTRNILVFPFLKQPTKRWWSRSIAQLDLLSLALEEKPASFLRTQKFFRADELRVKHHYRTYSKVSDKLHDLIYSHFRDFMGGNSDPKALCTRKLGSFSLLNNEGDVLLWSISKVEFGQSILIWNIATALCYYSEIEDNDDVEMDIHRVESKHISDYLLYLLVSNPDMLPTGIGMIRYRDTCAEATRFFKEKGPITEKTEASRKLLEVDCSQVSSRKVKGDRCKSALFDGCRLASTLKKMERERRWKVVIQVWIEILAYAAAHCRGIHHMQQLQKGGEFLTHVWLLMAHLGITEQFQIFQGHARPRFIVS